MVVVRWTRGCHRLFHGKSGDGHHYHWHPCSFADIQDWHVVPVAFRSRGEGHEEPNRLHPHTAEYPMDSLWRSVGMADARLLRGAAVHHHHRHSLCQTAFQNGRTVACAIRKGRRTTYIKDNGNIQRRYIRRPTGLGRFLRHMVPAMQDDAPHPGAGERSVG